MSKSVLVGSVLLFFLSACNNSSEDAVVDPGVVSSDTSNEDGNGIDENGNGDTEEPEPEDPLVITNFFEAGIHGVELSEGSLATQTCTLEYVLYTPQNLATAPLVILGHGFQRSSGNMVGLARFLTSFGVRLATPDFCHSSLFDTDHQENAEDAVELSAHLAGGQPVIYIGHSAGGLSAVIAGNADSAAVGVLGLDLTDNDSLAANQSLSLDVPLLALIGDASSCNSEGNGDQVVENARDSLGIRIVGGSHCDFENPTSGLCTGFCGGQEASRVEVISALSAAFVASTFGIDATGSEWISGQGVEYQRLIAEGLIANF